MDSCEGVFNCYSSQLFFCLQALCDLITEIPLVFQNELLFTDIIKLSINGAVSEGQEYMKIPDMGNNQPPTPHYIINRLAFSLG